MIRDEQLAGVVRRSDLAQPLVGVSLQRVKPRAPDRPLGEVEVRPLRLPGGETGFHPIDCLMDRGGGLRARRHPHRERHVGGIERADRAVVLRLARQRAAELPELE